MPIITKLAFILLLLSIFSCDSNKSTKQTADGGTREKMLFGAGFADSPSNVRKQVISSVLENKDTLITTITETDSTFSYVTTSVTIDTVRKKYTVPPVVTPPTLPVGCNSEKPKTWIVEPTKPGEIYILNAMSRGWKGGDTLKIRAGTYSVIEIDSFGGDPCRDIIIINMGGLVNVNGSIRLKNNIHHVRVTGTGVSGLTYGIKCKNFALNRLNHYTMDHIEIGNNPNGVGIYCKQDPYLNQPWTQYPNYVSNKITIDNCYVHDIGGEGMYIGHTYPGGDPDQGNRIPQRLDSVTVSNCIVINTTWDGVQVSNARNGCRIFNNRVTNFGTLDKDGQRAGIIMGGNTSGDVYNNVVTNGLGNGIQFFGYGKTGCYGNAITNVGNTTRTTGGEESIYGQPNNHGPEVNPKQDPSIHNNQINNPKKRGIVRFNATSSSGLITFRDNKICDPPADLNKMIFLPPGSIITGNTSSCN